MVTLTLSQTGSLFSALYQFFILQLFVLRGTDAILTLESEFSPVPAAFL